MNYRWKLAGALAAGGVALSGLSLLRYAQNQDFERFIVKLRGNGYFVADCSDRDKNDYIEEACKSRKATFVLSIYDDGSVRPIGELKKPFILSAGLAEFVPYLSEGDKVAGESAEEIKRLREEREPVLNMPANLTPKK